MRTEMEDYRAEQAYELSHSGHEPYTLEWIDEALPALLFYLVIGMFVCSFALWGLRELTS